MADKDKARQLFKKGMAEFLDQNYDNNIWRSQQMKLEEMGIADAFDR